MYLAADKRSRGIVEVLVGKDRNDSKAEINFKCDYKLQQKMVLYAAIAYRYHNILAILARKNERSLKWKDLD